MNDNLARRVERDIGCKADHGLLGLIASWNVYRLQAMTRWASNDHETLFGINGDSGDPPFEALERLETALTGISYCKPRTTMGAAEMLKVVLTILAHREIDPECCLAQGPINDILRHVMEALANDSSAVLRAPKNI